MDICLWRVTMGGYIALEKNKLMKIMHIIPGSGGSFYCGNCLRDSKYVEALRKSDHHGGQIAHVSAPFCR